MIKKILPIFAIIAFLAGPVLATDYYVDSAITDVHIASPTPDYTTYNPTTFATTGGTANVYKTIADVNAKSFRPGDHIYFRRGQTWQGMLYISWPGYSGSPITIGAYGAGDNPIINGADQYSSWSNQGGNIWRKSARVEPANLNVNGVYYTKVYGLGNLTGKNLFCYSSGYIYLYKTSDPGTVEASARDHCIAIDDVSYITVNNITVKNGNMSGIGIFKQSSYITIDGNTALRNSTGILRWADYGTSTNIVIQNNDISYSNASGIDIVNVANKYTIQGNTVYNNAFDSSLFWNGGIKLFGSGVTNITIKGNKVYSNGYNNNPFFWGGIWLDTCGSNIVIKQNNCYGNYGHGIFIECTSGVNVYNNLSDYNQRFGISVEGRNSPEVSYNNQIYNNTCYGNEHGIAVRGEDPGYTSAVVGNLVKNNICYGNTVSQLRCEFGGENDGKSGRGNVYTYNCYGPDRTNLVTWGYDIIKTTYTAWEAAYGSWTHSVQANPGMINPPTDFHLQAGSPCKNAGDTSVNSIVTDNYDGTARLNQNSVGAY